MSELTQRVTDNIIRAIHARTDLVQSTKELFVSIITELDHSKLESKTQATIGIAMASEPKGESDARTDEAKDKVNEKLAPQKDKSKTK